MLGLVDLSVGALGQQHGAIRRRIAYGYEGIAHDFLLLGGEGVAKWQRAIWPAESNPAAAME